jgi:hypothetical protein
MPGKGKMTGPDLKDVSKRRADDWLAKWIKSPSTVLKSGDAYAQNLVKEYNGTVMSEFGHLSDADISNLIAFLKNPPKEQAAGPQQPGHHSGVPAAAKTDNTLHILIVLTVVLLILAIVFSKVKKALTNLLRQKQGLPPLPELSPVEWMQGNKRIVALIVIFLFLVGSKQGWDALMAIGVNQGYKPEQPIAFSHKIHAGDNGINCKYCHFGAEKGKAAGIPSANVCMNCHKFIKEGTTTGTTEIAKIYAALDYDPAKMQYGTNQKPIQWTRVHNLPDLAYFNHSQHVTVGKIECQTCHGKVEEMDVAEQFAPLTMGWCINCHRDTEIDKSNNYYKDLHEKLMKRHGTKDKLTVEKIGGLECARCHY